MTSSQHKLSRRDVLIGFAGIGAGIPAHAANTGAAVADALTFAINEAATTAVSISDLVTRYEPLTKLLIKASHQRVLPVASLNVSSFRKLLAESVPPAFIFAKTVDILAEQVSLNRYVPMVKVDVPYVAGIILAPGFRANSLSELVGFDVLLPPPDTMTAKLAIAAFHDAGLPVAVLQDNERFPTTIRDKITVRHVRYQEAIPATLERKFWYKAGVVNPTVLGKWKGTVLQKFRPWPNWSIAAAMHVAPAVISAATSALVAMHEYAEGAAALADMKIKRFVHADRAEYIALAAYVK